MAGIVFDPLLPSITETGIQFTESVKDNQQGLFDGILLGNMPNWSLTVTAGTGTAERPQFLEFRNDPDRVRLNISWSTSGATAGSPTQVILQYSTNSGGNWTNVRTVPVTYDGSGNMTGATQASGLGLWLIAQIGKLRAATEQTQLANVIDISSYGSATDITSYLNAAIAALASTGGTVVIPRDGQISSEVVIPDSGIYIRGTGKPRLSVTAAIAGSVFNFNGASIRKSGGISGVILDGASRGFTAVAAVNVENFDECWITDLKVENFRGSGLRVVRSIDGIYENIKLNSCGDTSRPALFLAGTGAGLVCEGATFRNVAIRNGYLDSYTRILVNNVNNTFSDFYYTAANADTIADTDQTFLVCQNGNNNKFSKFHFGTHLGAIAKPKVKISADACTFDNVVFDGKCPPGSTMAEIIGNYFSGSNWSATAALGDAQDRHLLSVSGSYNTISSVATKWVGGVIVSGDYNVFSNMTFLRPKTAQVFHIQDTCIGTRITSTTCYLAEPEVSELALDEGSSTLLSGNIWAYNAGSTGYGIRTTSTGLLGIYTDNHINSCGKDGILLGEGIPSVVQGNQINHWDTGDTGLYCAIRVSRTAVLPRSVACSGNVMLTGGSIVQGGIRIEDIAGDIVADPCVQYWQIVGNAISASTIINAKHGFASGGKNTVI